MKSRRIRPFKYNTPSLFFVNSPFQALCMLEAIQEFHICDYKVYLVLYEDKRNTQLLGLLDSNKIEYSIIDSKKDRLYYYITLFFSFRFNKYKRAFIGFYKTDSFFYYAIRKLSFNSDIVYLDDGAATITLLNGQYERTFFGKIVFGMFRITSFLKHISIDNLYTIYDGLPNENFNIHICKLSRLKQLLGEKEKAGVLVVGTNSTMYCRTYNLSLDEYRDSLNQFFLYLVGLYPNDEIVYVPHGRDGSDVPLSLCKKYGFNYRKVDSTVELYILDDLKTPTAVYGFTSSALYNIKKITPSCQVYNMLLSKDERLERISEYYETIGIKTILFGV